MRMSEEELHEAASSAMGGLDDFGDDGYREGLGVLLDACASSPHAGGALDQRIRAGAVNALAGRLSSQAGWNARPAVLDAPLPPVVAVLGLPRSGTTALHQLLAADPGFQWIPAWLAARPRVRPPRERWADEPAYQQRVEAYRSTGPNPLHDVAPDDPEECLPVMTQSFTSMTWVSSTPVPDYHEWYIRAEERPSYRRFVDQLRLIGADDPDRPWLLKNPSHTFGFDAMADVFPGTVFVHIYRDPAESIVSGCSLIANMGTGPGSFTPEELGAHRLRIWSLAAERFDGGRAKHPDRQVVDVDYREFVKDPIASARGIYAGLGLELTDEAVAGMDRYLRERPRERFAPHRYSAADFGLTEEGIRERMAGYVDRYGVA
jgi:hypothetical protein